LSTVESGNDCCRHRKHGLFHQTSELLPYCVPLLALGLAECVLSGLEVGM
jgi:hypothetical protein